ncbi:hypothetical protein [Streptomyces adelaidensis]|uniref:hypothetical protein n=1 Tax=Streptomyces adelaidensis TaxID=2796465 RepID=UPI00190598E7|nr:hypothetical protein [Streptomyces adelaidensis]
MRYCLAQSAQFLRRLRERGPALATCSRYAIDTWLRLGLVRAAWVASFSGCMS